MDKFEELKNNKFYSILMWIFVFVSIISVTYAVLTMRGMYEDGTAFMLKMLDNISNGIYPLIIDAEHPRFMIWSILEYPVYGANLFFHINNKYALMMIFTAVELGLPLLLLFWNYKLSKRTQRLDIFFWSLANWCLFIIPFTIFSFVEIIIGSTLQFILFNYLVQKCEYRIRDILGIILCLVIFFGTYEYVVFLGIIFFIASIFYAKKAENKKDKIIKFTIGIGSLAASIFDFVYMLNVKGEGGEVQRFIREAVEMVSRDFININFILSVLAIILLVVYLFKKELFSKKAFIIITLLFSGLFIKQLLTLQTSLVPMLETHLRTMPCYVIPLIFIGIICMDLKNKEITPIKLQNFICIVLMCGIFQSAWQIVDSYFWNQHVEYMKTELRQNDGALYIPHQHEEMHGFYNDQLRRFFWLNYYAAISIIFSENYNQKTLLLHPDFPPFEGDRTDREELFVVSDDYISIPPHQINIKGKFWDLTECAKALDKYNKENNIPTYKENLL